MDMKSTYVTINHTEDFGGVLGFRVGDTLTLRKDHNNDYDDEAIMVYGKHDTKCGYVANSVESVARGTMSAGRLYDRIDESCECIIQFILDGVMIATVKSGTEK